jgi:hypothetical protein
MNIREQTVFDSTFEIGNSSDGASEGVISCELSGCVISFVNPSEGAIRWSRLTDCEIIVKRLARDFQMTDTHFRRCKFTGKYFDTVFGSTDLEPMRKGCTGGLEDCDFSQASLHMCSFHNCDPNTLKFPSWPHFTVINPWKNRDDWMAIPFPAWFRSSQKVIAMIPRDCAVTENWQKFAKEHKDTTDLEEIRQLMAGKDYIVM